MSNVPDGKVAPSPEDSRGIGAATARRLADDAAGVAISYLASPDRAAAVVEPGPAHEQDARPAA